VGRHGRILNVVVVCVSEKCPQLVRGARTTRYLKKEIFYCCTFVHGCLALCMLSSSTYPSSTDHKSIKLKAKLKLNEIN
jgi:hypothetical protein